MHIEAFRIRVVARGSILTGRQLRKRQAKVDERLEFIFKALKMQNRISVGYEYEEEMWAIVRIKPAMQMPLELELEMHALEMAKAEACSASAQFKNLVGDLVLTIRQARVDVYSLDALYDLAQEAHRFLEPFALAVSARPEIQEVTTVDASDNKWTMPVPQALNRPRATDDVLAMRFKVALVGVDFAYIDLEKAVRLQLGYRGRSIRLFWTSLTQSELGISSFLHERMLKNSFVETLCGPIRNKNGAVTALSLSDPASLVDRTT